MKLTFKRLCKILRDPPYEIIEGIYVRQWEGLSRLDSEAIAKEIIRVRKAKSE